MRSIPPARALALALLVIPAVHPVPARGQQSDSSRAPVFERATGAFFALSVADAAASARWYSEVLGLDVVMEIPKGETPGVKVLEGGGLLVELIERDDAAPLASVAPGRSDAQQVYGIVKAGFVVDDFDATVERLRSRGVEILYGPFPAQADQRANLLVRDVDGNLLQIFGEYATE